jgi:hypothetical protein
MGTGLRPAVLQRPGASGVSAAHHRLAPFGIPAANHRSGASVLPAAHHRLAGCGLPATNHWPRASGLTASSYRPAASGLAASHRPATAIGVAAKRVDAASGFFAGQRYATAHRFPAAHRSASDHRCAAAHRFPADHGVAAANEVAPARRLRPGRPRKWIGTQRRRLMQRHPMQLPQQILQALLEAAIVAEINPKALAQKGRDQRLGGVVAHDWHELDRVGVAGHMAGNNHALVAGASLALFGLGHVVGRAHHQHPVGLTDAEIHEAHHIASKAQLPLIQRHLHTATSQPRGQLPYPVLVGVGIMRIGEEHPRGHASRVKALGPLCGNRSRRGAGVASWSRAGAGGRRGLGAWGQAGGLGLGWGVGWGGWGVGAGLGPPDHALAAEAVPGSRARQRQHHRTAPAPQGCLNVAVLISQGSGSAALPDDSAGADDVSADSAEAPRTGRLGRL